MSKVKKKSGKKSFTCNNTKKKDINKFFDLIQNIESNRDIPKEQIYLGSLDKKKRLCILKEQYSKLILEAKIRKFNCNGKVSHQKIINDCKSSHNFKKVDGFYIIEFENKKSFFTSFRNLIKFLLKNKIKVSFEVWEGYYRGYEKLGGENK